MDKWFNTGEREWRARRRVIHSATCDSSQGGINTIRYFIPQPHAQSPIRFHAIPFKQIEENAHSLLFYETFRTLAIPVSLDKSPTYKVPVAFSSPRDRGDSLTNFLHTRYPYATEP